ncbi:tRNA lysidine(34) synthetase TilS [Halpernia sp.]|uniref:tRNA lysidine(34) synthetase TilS n=1 Tax=Halpernia sp. TaxID=2782209 RepID=UPI003A9290C0
MYLNKQNFQNQVSTLMPNYKEMKFLLAVSGGSDSMVLAHLFKNLEINFQIAHINYKLRGEESNLDEKVVEDFCKKNNIKFHLYNVSEQDKKPENSIQLWARNLRYSFFEKIKLEENLDYLATAHHLNDELETFIINLSRASGLKGLSGIPKNSNQIFRPLLKFSKEDIYRFAAENKLEFREDKSNQKSDYLRNFIRNVITPQLLKTNSQFLENFSKTLTFLEESENFISKEIEKKRKTLCDEINSKIVFNKAKLKIESNFIKFKLLKKYGFKEPHEISKIFSAENGSRFFSNTHQLKVNSTQLIIKDLDEKVIDFKPISIKKNDEIHIKDFCVDYKEIGKVWEINSDKINWPLKLRQPKSEDIFNPIGMKGKKKVKKFIRDLKLSDSDELVLVLADSEDQILGVIPFRQNGEFFAENKNLSIYL